MEMWDSRLNFGEFTDKLISLRDYYYQVGTYIVSHRQLRIRLESMKTDEKLYMSFHGVDYIQLPTSWQGFALKPGLPQKCQEILKNAHLAHMGSDRQLFSIEEGDFVVHIICNSLMITNKPPYEYLK